VRAAARASRFTLVGLARAEPLDPQPLQSWLASGYAADMDWMARRQPEQVVTVPPPVIVSTPPAPAASRDEPPARTELPAPSASPARPGPRRDPAARARALAFARDQWRAVKEGSHDATYWQQDERGRWQRKA